MDFRNREDHAFLGFGNPNLRIRQARYLSGCFLKPDLGPGKPAISPTALENPPCAAIGDGGIQTAIARGEDHVHHHLLGDGIADLHRPARERFTFSVSSAEENVAP